jgi:MerR family transcriptional regulator, thiopeptide resistance regulator
MAYTVGEVARLAGITNRTLHHYDEIGLLTPSERTPAGYRLYDGEDLERLQEILYFRELGFGLEEIRTAVTDLGYDRGEALRQQRTLLLGHIERLESLIASLDAAIDAHEKGMTMNKEDMFEVFGDFDPAEYEEEVEQRWSGPALDESRRLAATYSKEDWIEIRDESETIAKRFAELKKKGIDPGSTEAMEIAESHRLHIGRFYPCSYEMHQALGDMYVQDPRFTAYWDKYSKGLAPFVNAAIAANARR